MRKAAENLTVLTVTTFHDLQGLQQFGKVSRASAANLLQDVRVQRLPFDRGRSAMSPHWPAHRFSSLTHSPKPARQNKALLRSGSLLLRRAYAGPCAYPTLGLGRPSLGAGWPRPGERRLNRTKRLRPEAGSLLGNKELLENGPLRGATPRPPFLHPLNWGVQRTPRGPQR